jgi:hypothetical protein
LSVIWNGNGTAPRYGSNGKEGSRNRMNTTHRLTTDLIARYRKLSSHDRELLASFASIFPGSTIEWISKEEAARRRDSTIQANQNIDTEVFNHVRESKNVSRGSVGS